jgi:hypothetical protein
VFIIDTRTQRVKKRDGALEPILLTLKIPELLCKRGVEVALDANQPKSGS